MDRPYGTLEARIYDPAEDMLKIEGADRVDAAPTSSAGGPMARVVRAEALSIASRDFVEAACSMGASRTRVLVRHVVPNILTPALVVALVGSRVILFGGEPVVPRSGRPRGDELGLPPQQRPGLSGHGLVDGGVPGGGHRGGRDRAEPAERGGDRPARPRDGPTGWALRRPVARFPFGGGPSAGDAD